jgi:hypothetical protein
MRISGMVLCLFILPSCTASSGDTSSVDAGRAILCDGSQALKLRIFLAASGSELRGSFVRIEHGYSSFGLDGECTYYMSAGWTNGHLDRDRGWRHGTLPQDALVELSTALNPSRLQDLQVDCPDGSGFADATPWIVASSESRSGCIVPGKKLSAVLDTIRSRTSILWSNGREMDGPIRLSAAGLGGDASTVYPWPLAAPLADFMIREDVPEAEYQGYSVGISKLVTDATDAARLRVLRDQYIADRTAAPGLFTDGLEASDGTSLAFVYMRDALPYEDEHGLWPF